jgi:hypothetical protein
MADLMCKYCGKKFVTGGSCSHSPTKKHIAVADGTNCIYCGRKSAPGLPCVLSPTKKHKLAE